jgi:hypothetical protein
MMKKNALTQGEKENQGNDNPALSKMIERNIRVIIHFRAKAAHNRDLQDRGWNAEIRLLQAIEISQR